MVELTLDPVDWQRYAADHYISVRVGECQKLSKISASRTFKFSASAASSRYGKVEIFRKVGSTVVCLDPRVGAPSVEMSIPLEDSAMQLRVGLSSQEGPAQSQEQAQAAKQSRYDQAKEYLDKHHLEVRLSEAMQAVLRERPDDPAAFVARRLAENGGIVAKPQQATPASPVPSPAPEPPKVAPVQPDVQASAPPKAAAAADARPDASADAPFVAYYGLNFRDIGSGALQGISSKFPTRAPKAPEAPGRSPEELLGLTRDALLQASAGGRLLAELQRSAPEEPGALVRSSPPVELGATGGGPPEPAARGPAPARAQQAAPLQAPPRAVGKGSVFPSACMYGSSFYSTGLRPGLLIF